jgi:membrane-bound lytic murein transglycosylase A
MIKIIALLTLPLGLALANTSNLPSRSVAVPSQSVVGSSVAIAQASPKPTSKPSSPVPNAATPSPANSSTATPCCPEPVNSEQVGLDDQLLATNGDRKALLESIDNSLRYLETPLAAKAYSNYQVRGINQERVKKSLVRFRQLVAQAKSANQLRDAVKKEFVFYQAIGKDNKGGVQFTGYYEPIYQASRVPTAEYKYPLYKQPANFESWPKPNPTRLQLEGVDGLQAAKGPLAGSELLYMKDRFEVVLVQIQGSAKFVLPDGKTTTVGYNGGTDYPYDSIGKMLAKDQKVTQSQLTLQGIIRYFKENPLEMDVYLPRYNRFAFMKETFNSKPMGSLNVTVTPERSIATDKALMPPGALALVHTKLPFYNSQQVQQRLVSRYVLDQDTGSAIKGPGRVDYFMGVGKNAGERAGVTGSTGQLYYLLLKK